MAKKYSIGNKVVFFYNESTQLGAVEKKIKYRKGIRYVIRGEGGRLYPAMGVDTNTGPGKIISKLTTKMFETETLKPVEV